MLYTLRKHWKKSILAACLSLYGAYYASGRFREYLVRRELCSEAKTYGQEPISALEKPRRMYVFLNPTANNGGALKMYEKDVAPILHLAAIDVTLIKTDYEGHAKTILGYIDPTVDGIIVAGGDGTLLEVITGFIRLQDNDTVSRIPIGVVPLGRTNRFYKRQFNSPNQDARTVGNAALAIVKGNTTRMDVIEITSDGVRPTYSLSGLTWGLLQEVKQKIDAKKHWWAGPWKKEMAFVTRTVRNWPSYYSALLGIDGCAVDMKSDLKNGGNNGVTDSQDPRRDDSVVPSHLENQFKDKMSISLNSDMCALNLEIGDFHGNSMLHVQLLGSDMQRADFIANGIKWMKNNYNIVQYVDSKEFHGEQVKLCPRMDYVTFFHIDGEEFEAKDISLKLLKDKLCFFN